MLRCVLVVPRVAARLIVVARKMKGNRKEEERRDKPGMNGICSKLSCAGGQEAMVVRLKNINGPV
jgi:hypothetical protein